MVTLRGKEGHIEHYKHFIERHNWRLNQKYKKEKHYRHKIKLV